MLTREIEMAVCMGDNTWDTVMVEIPYDTPDSEIKELGEQAALKMFPDGDVAGTWVYCTYDDDVPDVKEALKVVCNLAANSVLPDCQSEDVEIVRKAFGISS